MKKKIYHKYISSNKIGKFFTKLLVLCIITLGILIYNVDHHEQIESLKELFYNKSFNFASFNKAYNKISGQKEQMVMTTNFNYNHAQQHLNGMAYKLNKNENISAFCDGVVVFIGQKDGYNNTVIIQGVDGFDIWYGNLENVNVNLYDYVKGGNLLGNVNEELYLVIMKNEKYYDLAEYQNRI